MNSGNLHHFVGADNSCISWGRAEYGELGYGPHGKKSSAVPKKVDILDRVHVIGVACGLGHSMVIVDRTNIADRLEQLDVYDGKDFSEVEAVPETETQAPKKTAKKGAVKASDSAKKRKKAKDSSESEDEYNDEGEEDSDNSDGMVNGQSENKRGKGAQNTTSGEKRGRGRPPSANKVSPPAKSSTGKRGRPRKS